MYIRVLDLKTLRKILKDDDDAEGTLRYLIDGQRTPLLYAGTKENAKESITLLASIPRQVRAAMDAYPELFVEYTENELFDHEEQDVDEEGNKLTWTDDEGTVKPVMVTVVRTTDIFDTFHSTEPYEVEDEKGKKTTKHPPIKPLVIA